MIQKRKYLPENSQKDVFYSIVQDCVLSLGHDLRTLTTNELLINSSPVVLSTSEFLMEDDNYTCLSYGEMFNNMETENVCDKCGDKIFYMKDLDESTSADEQTLKTRGRPKGYLNNFAALVFLICVKIRMIE